MTLFKSQNSLMTEVDLTHWSALKALRFSPKAIRRGNTVILRGLLEVGTIDISSYTTAFTLQVGYRPKVRQFFVCAMPHSSIGLVDILASTGEVLIKYLLNDTVSPASLLDISNIRFEAA